MMVSAFGLAWRSHVILRRPLIYCVPKVQYSSSVVAVGSVAEPVTVMVKDEKDEVAVRRRSRVGKDNKQPEWKKFSSKELGIKMSLISKPTRLVLSRLRKKGYEVYLVGGCVRDLILKKTPKDFDIITSAELKEIKQTFIHCEIVGKRFPICHVHVNDTIVEVSSFSTCNSKSVKKFDNNFSKHPGCSRDDYIRWRNCIQRDFTINGLMFDPYTKIVYDYMGGMEDIRKAKMHTVKPANLSFVEDRARILRAVRIAARLGFRFSRDIALSVRELSGSVLRLDKGRILMEMNYMLAFGSAEASLRLLWRFGLLEILLPIQGFEDVMRDLTCFSIAILAFHKALADQPRDPLVVAAFSLAVHSGGSLLEAVQISMNITRPHDSRFHELLEYGDVLSQDALIDQVVDLAASAKAALCKMTDRYYVSQAMIKYPKAPRSDLVFISLALSLRVCKIFECIGRGMGKETVPRRGEKINYESLALGNLPEVRHTFARIVFDTVYPPNLKRDST
ncbi:uncharacterized protein LOC107429691 isoform X2 [Ziziphus jujuba]|uniref:Uncharacterized protein LOC107429691 isoform X2 n=1 Tax=Ziziphus jujuba TaxID=326968 RepID=A0ABM3ZYW6_ZIZJJ|nr:uncharacterized protein LOC107429691 isoform X2 [Ziziphus jujuba]